MHQIIQTSEICGYNGHDRDRVWMENPVATNIDEKLEEDVNKSTDCLCAIFVALQSSAARVKCIDIIGQLVGGAGGWLVDYKMRNETTTMTAVFGEILCDLHDCVQYKRQYGHRNLENRSNNDNERGDAKASRGKLIGDLHVRNHLPTNIK